MTARPVVSMRCGVTHDSSAMHMVEERAGDSFSLSSASSASRSTEDGRATSPARALRMAGRIALVGAAAAGPMSFTDRRSASRKNTAKSGKSQGKLGVNQG